MKDKCIHNPIGKDRRTVSLGKSYRTFLGIDLSFLYKFSLTILLSELFIGVKKIKLILWKALVSVLLLAFSISFTTSFVLLLVKPLLKENSSNYQHLFSDMPIENPLYSSCKHLIQNKILTVSNISFNPFQDISLNYWNFIVMEIEKYQKIKFPNTVLFSNKDIVTPKLIKKKCILVALALGITPGMDNIPEPAFADISKINILSILDNYLSLSKSEKT